MKHAFIIALGVLAFSAAGAEVAVRTGASTGETTNAPAKQTTVVQIKEQTNSLFQGKAGAGIDYRPTPQVSPESSEKPVTSYRLEIKLRAPQPNNVVPSKKRPGLEYRGSFVQAAKNNPLQLINPLAPAEYGDGQANVVCHPVTKRPEGLKLLQISF